ncbi:N-acetylmuramic acid 6-phosphate etherase [Consotaella aegiceratis]|uniref:N-acetylmuramic acid 6-phosphate etherase n=1 Tax=Consotaella aegiceratis TaxID=3097961 RepID=UPI002F41482E
MPETDISSNRQAADRLGEWRETERRSPRFEDLDLWSRRDVLEALLDGQQHALHALWGALDSIEAAVEAAVGRLADSRGRLVYVGAGTSGRLAVLDGVELTPTFSWPRERLVYLFAGGGTDFSRAREGAEDDAEAARQGIEAAGIGVQDVVIGIAASGTTLYTRVALQSARVAGALTIALANNPGSPLLEDAEIGILLRTGPEVLAGSTRMAAGTSQKVALNLFSTAVMIGLHKVYRGYMVDVQATNAKLVKRAENMVVALSGCRPEAARAALAQTGNSVKPAVLVVNGATPDEATALLGRHKGNLRAALNDVPA